MSWHRVSPSPFLSSSSSSLTTQLHYTNSYTYSHPNLNFLQHCTDTLPTCNVVCPRGAWFENRPHSMPSIRLVRNLKCVIVQWVGIRTHTHLCLYSAAFFNLLKMAIYKPKQVETIREIIRSIKMIKFLYEGISCLIHVIYFCHISLNSCCYV